MALEPLEIFMAESRRSRDELMEHVKHIRDTVDKVRDKMDAKVDEARVATIEERLLAAESFNSKVAGAAAASSSIITLGLSWLYQRVTGG